MAVQEAQGRRDLAEPARCSNCGAQQPPQALYCPHCGTAQTEETWAECEITWSRGDEQGEFIAARFDGLVPVEVICSQLVRWPGGHLGPEEKPRVVHALGTLVAQLERDGWERLEQGSDWYAYRFRRRASAARDATELGTTSAVHQLREAAAQRVKQQTTVNDELETIQPEHVEPLLIEPNLAESGASQGDIVESTSTRLEAGALDGVEPDHRAPSGSEPRTTEPEADIGEPWFARPRRTRELSVHGSEMMKTVLVDRISAYSFDT